MTDEETVMLTARIPSWLVQEITDLAARTGKSRTEVIYEALEAAYVANVPKGSDPKVTPGNRQGEM